MNPAASSFLENAASFIKVPGNQEKIINFVRKP